MQSKRRFDTEILETFSGVKEKKILSLNFFFPGEGGRAGGGIGPFFNIWKDTMAKLLLSLFKLIFFSINIYGWPEEWKLYHTLKMMSYITAYRH